MVGDESKERSTLYRYLPRQTRMQQHHNPSTASPVGSSTTGVTTTTGTAITTASARQLHHQ